MLAMTDTAITVTKHEEKGDEKKAQITSNQMRLSRLQLQVIT